MLINCPCCGMRMASEFTYMGDATKIRPFDNEQDVSKWNSYIFERTNPKGWHQEFWHHSGGCRSVVKVNRNTETHEIRSVELVGPWRESLPSVQYSQSNESSGDAE